MTTPISWLRRVVTIVGLAWLVLTATPVMHDNWPVAMPITPGVQGDCGDSTCG